MYTARMKLPSSSYSIRAIVTISNVTVIMPLSHGKTPRNITRCWSAFIHPLGVYSGSKMYPTNSNGKCDVIYL